MIDSNWLTTQAKKYKNILTIDNHFLGGGLGQKIQALVSNLDNISVLSHGLKDFPTSGMNGEVLEHHGYTSKKIEYLLTNSF